jgi:hypothetical protein
MNLFFNAFAYVDGWFLNQTLAREVSCSPPIQSAGSPIGSNTYQFSSPYSSANIGTALDTSGTSELEQQVDAKLNAYLGMGLSKFFKLTNANTQNYIYQHVIDNPNAPPAAKIVDFSIVTTIITIEPILPIPMFVPVPGINQPFQYKFATQLLQEETGLN